MRSLESITFDSAGWVFQFDRESVRVWHTPSGDGVGLYYYPVSPDIQANMDAIDQVRACYRRSAMEAGGAIIEIDTPQVDGCKSIRAIIKVPQQPAGMTYLGSFTLPFRYFSYVIKIQCLETGTIGIRDSVVLEAMLNSREVAIGENGKLRGWMQDPYDASLTSVLARNKSDAELYDLNFPGHPLSRLRRLMRQIQLTLKVGDDIKREPAFDFKTS
jgi:hypothetical protein